MFDAFHLPSTIAGADRITLERDGVTAVAPRLSASNVRRICTQLRDARAALANVPVAHVIEVIDEAARRLREPVAGSRADLLHGIAAFTGYSAEMAHHVVQRMSADWLAAPLERLIDQELGGPLAIDDFIVRNGVRSRAVAPHLTLHFFSGNVPGVSVTSIVRALLVKSAVLGKTAVGEPLLAPHFAQLLSDIDPIVGACVAVTYWSGGDEAIEAAALEHADAVIHYGDADAIASVRARAPRGTRFIEHGPRVSFAVVDGGMTHETSHERAALDLARSVALFDQQGCVSPQVLYVVGGDHDAARTFAASVAAALDTVQQQLPRGRLDAGAAAAVRALRTRAEFRSIRGENVEIWSGAALGWTLVLDSDTEFAGSCLNRTLLVKHVPAITNVITSVQPLGHLLQTVGVAGFRDEQLRARARALTYAGVSRITTLADMPWPPVTWHHDGRGPLTELIRWADLES